MRSEEEKFFLYDEDIRDPLFTYLEEHYGKIRIIEEKTLGKSRADFFLITENSIIGIEIKSDVDSYTRLKQQVKNYEKYCDLNYLAIGASHAKHAAKHVPSTWGILVFSVIEGMIVVEEQRCASKNPNMKKEQQITIMWRPELQKIIDKNQLPRYKQKSKKFVQQKLLEKLDWSVLKACMCDELFERDYTLWDEELNAYHNS